MLYLGLGRSLQGDPYKGDAIDVDLHFAPLALQRSAGVKQTHIFGVLAERQQLNSAP